MYVLLAASTLVHVAVVPFVMVDYLMLARGIIHGPLIDIEAIVHAHRHISVLEVLSSEAQVDRLEMVFTRRGRLLTVALARR